MKKKSYRRYDKAAFNKSELRPVTQSSWVPGDWVRHRPSRTWFEAFESLDLEGTLSLVGFDFYGQDVVVPLAECTHAFDPRVDG